MTLRDDWDEKHDKIEGEDVFAHNALGPAPMENERDVTNTLMDSFARAVRSCKAFELHNPPCQLVSRRRLRYQLDKFGDPTVHVRGFVLSDEDASTIYEYVWLQNRPAILVEVQGDLFVIHVRKMANSHQTHAMVTPIAIGYGQFELRRAIQAAFMAEVDQQIDSYELNQLNPRLRENDKLYVQPVVTEEVEGWDPDLYGRMTYSGPFLVASYWPRTNTAILRNLDGLEILIRYVKREHGPDLWMAEASGRVAYVTLT